MQLFFDMLRGVMVRAPPPEPSSAAINLMVGVGNFQVSSAVRPTDAQLDILHSVMLNVARVIDAK